MAEGELLFKFAHGYLLSLWALMADGCEMLMYCLGMDEYLIAGSAFLQSLNGRVNYFRQTCGDLKRCRFIEI